jgi:glycosyltransferase involved in cell wall biosynthesis
MHSHRPPAFLAVVGDVNSPRSYSGTPYYFLAAAKRANLLDSGLNLSVDTLPWRMRRMTWNLRKTISGAGIGGYQYSQEFLEALWRPARKNLSDSVVMNCGQLYPQSIVRDASIKKWFFIDQTLSQYYRYYEARVGKRTAREAIQREKEGYEAAAGVIANSRWAAESVISEYAIPPERVHVALQGANFDQNSYRQWEEAHSLGATVCRPGSPLRLVFVGKEWYRKGLDRLLESIKILEADGIPTRLRVIGCDKTQVPRTAQNISSIEWLGYIDKSRDPLRYMQLISECDVGCLLSRAEAGGIAIREYHALGLVVLGTQQGGAVEQLIPEASLSVSPQAPPDEIASELSKLYREPSFLEQLRIRAWQRKADALWDRSVNQILSFWPYQNG